MKLADEVVNLHEAEKMKKGKVRFFDAKRMSGVVVGDDGVMYDINLDNPNNKDYQKWGKKLKKGMEISFGVVDDPDFNMAIISDKSFK